MEAWSFVHKKLEFDFKITLSHCDEGNGVPQGSKLSYHKFYNSMLQHLQEHVYFYTNLIYKWDLGTKNSETRPVWPIKKIGHVMIVSNLENVDCKIYM